MNLIYFASWFQFCKFDLRFLTVNKLMDLMEWTIESDKMASIQFYCQATVFNYFNLLFLLAASALSAYLLHLLANRLKMLVNINNFIQNKINKNKIAWIFIHLFLLFFIISLIKDILNVGRYPLHCSISLMIFVLMLTYLILK